MEGVDGAVDEVGGALDEVGGAVDEVGKAVDEVGGAVEVAVATVRIEPGLERKAETEAELLAELGLTLTIHRTVLNDVCKSYYAKKNYKRRTKCCRRTTIAHVVV